VHSGNPIFRPPSSRGAAIRLALALILAAVALVPAFLAGGASIALADISGNTYTPPHFDTSVSWDDNWFVIEEDSDAFFDTISLTNGLTYLSVYFEQNDYSSTDQVVALMSGEWRSDSQTSDFGIIKDGNGDSVRGGDDTRSFAGFSYTYTYDDGSAEDLGVYFEARSINDGEVMMSVFAVTPIEHFFTEYQLAGITLPDVTVVQPGPDVIVGEPAPVFADGVWRIAVATAAHGPEFRDIGLAQKDGKAWFVAIVDVTNWSDKAEVFSSRDVRLSLTGAKKPARIAPASTAAVGKRLELDELTEDATISIQPGETSRVALVYSVAANATDPLLTLGKSKLPMADHLELGISGENLPTKASAPETVAGTIVSASDGQTMRLKVAGESGAQKIRLLGVEPPARGECMADAAESLLDGNAGEQVLIEEDAAITGGSGSMRYVWLVNADGTRTLLNQKLIADGLAQAAAVPDDARFGLWLLTSERAAEEGQIGLWAGCEAPEATATTAKATPSPTPAKAKPTSTPSAKATSTPAPKATSTPAAGSAVKWIGEIEDIGTINFTIADGAMTHFGMRYDVPCTVPNIYSPSSVTSKVLTPPVPLANGSFTLEFPVNGSDASITVSGSLTDDDSAVGTFTLPPVPACTTEELRVEWTATAE
jgi:endonuclease YncB( thermonuclease family)